MDKHDKYLGMPTTVGCSNKEYLEFSVSVSRRGLMDGGKSVYIVPGRDHDQGNSPSYPELHSGMLSFTKKCNQYLGECH